MKRGSRARPGRHLPPVQTACLAAVAPTWLRELLAACGAGGYRLSPSTRPFLRRDGTVSIRLVVRQADQNVTLTIIWVASRETIQPLLDSACLSVPDYCDGAAKPI
jgi:hypothetical protein